LGFSIDLVDCFLALTPSFAHGKSRYPLLEHSDLGVALGWMLTLYDTTNVSLTFQDTGSWDSVGSKSKMQT
jgi:hypothetical protein